MATTFRTVGETARDLSRGAKDSVVALGRSASRKLDKARDHTGGALHGVASSVRKGSARMNSFGTGAAKRLDATASFVEDVDFKGVVAGLRRFGQKHRTFTYLVAGAIGFWTGSALTRVARSHGHATKTIG
jgi:hypothetical protein